MILEVAADGQRTPWRPRLHKGRRVEYRVLREGLALNITDDPSGGIPEQRFALPAGLSLSVTLCGTIETTVGHRPPLAFGGNGDAAQAAMVAMNEVDLAIRHAQPVGAFRQLTVLASPDWLAELNDGKAALRAFWANQAAMTCWRPSPDEVALVYQLLREDDGSTLWNSLVRESRTLALLASAIGKVAGEANSQINSSWLSLHKIHRLQDMIRSSGSQPPTLDEMAKEVGLSVSTMQRGFKAAFGRSIVDWMREQALLRAETSLQAGLPVSQVAYAAGYRSPANFSTAFRRAFGYAPRDVRGRGSRDN